ncbi:MULTISPECIES: 2OG-Fe(II) oxygenase [Paraburkholderia]|uniref:2OG-Fe(II) oxygenase n=1 Tax=Paraburkholderia madseniana TaxID=2599607 RepID=A0AAP5EL07_9BURK|nr:MULTISPECIES: 2OG-Fe(II) oxygenase [Paraburkholderia]MCX4143772.1 2OG-Fe(II) oxygenase [Paraburkholderia madseniana]MDN7146726.1 2OG-Fe(II) oxygenase [Paraburkholderia sp. WS6]MDQ6405606.1 2OG-Fe(II) oxygenase [Paraburkholderia madseniana]
MNTVAKDLQSPELELELELELGFEPDLKHAGARESGSSTVTGSFTRRVDAIDWFDVEEELNGYGCAMLRNLLSAQECDALTALYPRDDLYRSRVVMARHGFGRGEYKYFAYPLPQLVAALRAELYPRLAPVANRWNEAMNIDVRYPVAHGEFIERCHAAGQLRPTPLMLQYAKDDYNCLHQDLYGEHVFPLQVAILLSEPGKDFTGGEFVMTEQRPRMQSRTEVVPLGKGDAVVFAVHHRPVQGTRGVYRVNLRHGVSRLRSGHRHTLGVIFHDAT